LTEAIARDIQQTIEEPARSWGVVVESILIKDLQLSPELLESLSAAAKQRRLGESKIIAAEAEVQSAQMMRKASDILNSQAAIQIRFFDTLQTMAKAPNTKVVFLSPKESGEGLMSNMKYQEA
jgi:regulator of protease activity HflC (stomatin/prohibitin superfamily)